jgi:hypothetical protein
MVDTDISHETEKRLAAIEEKLGIESPAPPDDGEEPDGDGTDGDGTDNGGE